MAEAVAEPAVGFPKSDDAAGGADAHPTVQEVDDMACMAVDWLSLLAVGPSGVGPTQAAAAGLAAAVALCSCTRCPFAG